MKPKNEVAKSKKKVIGGFSLKNKTRDRRTVVKVVDLKSSSGSLFEGNKDYDKEGRKLAISTTDEIMKNTEKPAEIVIKPVRPTLLVAKKQMDNETGDERKKTLSYGINIQSKDVENDKSRRRSPARFTEAAHSITQDGVTETTMDSYKKVPVESFGAAMLRGMGWTGSAKKAEKESLKEAEKLKSRPLLLGLGAKPSPIQLDPSYRVVSASYSPVMKMEAADGDEGERLDKGTNR
ncbi:hypothetical protein FOA43_000766 [Brettanomyces nanus]|uniref:Pre-mRNA-splicing factor n=1 Tax=Eeniella nana TaxID=13502 RepID=A0A875RZJ7_EENNA|nr:uncharacterized protein FOA43_000766 [Brettanomyces nanus]QPG73455.1 hypothetical protein FOA43_000766 [Brettanomyces nanus]